MVSTTLWLLLLLVPLQIALGDAHGLNTLKYQPTKLAAIEARWETGTRVPLTLFAIPDQKAQTNHFSIEIPDLGSLILTHHLDGRIRGLKEFPTMIRKAKKGMATRGSRSRGRWTTTEVGRQPWTVYGLMRTADSVSPSLTGANVLMSLLGYMAAYLIMFPAGILLMARIVRRGFDPATAEGPVESGRPASPVHALPAAQADGSVV